MSNIFFTSSWDDGHLLDSKLANLLTAYNVRGTFYIPKVYKADALSLEQVKDLADKHEVGAHTLTHPDLDKIEEKQLKEEIYGSKKYLEDLLNKEVPMFCYPRGLLTEQVKRVVKEAGYLGARSTQKFCFQRPTNLFEFGVSIHVYPFPFRKKDQHSYLINKHLFDPLLKNYKKIGQLGLSINSFWSLSNLLRNALEYAIYKGEIFHLYGHSWELERYGLWEELEKFLSDIQKKDNLTFLTNSECLREFKKPQLESYSFLK